MEGKGREGKVLWIQPLDVGLVVIHLFEEKAKVRLPRHSYLVA